MEDIEKVAVVAQLVAGPLSFLSRFSGYTFNNCTFQVVPPVQVKFQPPIQAR